MENCKRCGECCFFVVNGKRRKCKYLVIHDNYTSCRIYFNRLGKEIYPNVFCREIGTYEAVCRRKEK